MRNEENGVDQIILDEVFCAAGKFIQATGAFRRVARCYVEEMDRSPKRKSQSEDSLFRCSRCFHCGECVNKEYGDR